jgi:hypothetical protein
MSAVRHRQDAGVAHTVLYVPVPGLEPYIRWRHEVEGPEWLSPDGDHTHAHVTVLGPFVPEDALTPHVHTDLAALFADSEPFPFTLEEVRVFPSGLVYLHPEPAEPFAHLTEAVTGRFPNHPPYAGELAPVPHLSLCALGPGRDLDLVRAELAAVLPVRAVAEEVWLVRYEERGTRRLRRYRLGGVEARADPEATDQEATEPGAEYPGAVERETVERVRTARTES